MFTTEIINIIMTFIIPSSLFYAIVLANIAAVIILTTALFVRSRRYAPTTFMFMILLLWGVPIVGAVVVTIITITKR